MIEYLSLLSYGDTGWGDELLKGLLMTLTLALVTAPVALATSFLVAWGKEAGFKPIRMFARGYTTLFRSLPELLTLLILYYQSQGLVDAITGWLFPSVNIIISPFLAGVIALTLVFSALGSEVVRAAYHAVGRGQLEAAQSIGLSRRKVFLLVMLPQMWRHAMPAFGNLWLILLKDTSLVSIIALSDLVRYTNMAISSTREPFFFYSVMAFIFIVLAFLSGKVFGLLERRTTRGFAGER